MIIYQFLLQVALDRTRGTGLPAELAEDREMEGLVQDILIKFAAMLNVADSSAASR